MRLMMMCMCNIHYHIISFLSKTILSLNNLNNAGPRHLVNMSAVWEPVGIWKYISVFKTHITSYISSFEYIILTDTVSPANMKKYRQKNIKKTRNKFENRMQGPATQTQQNKQTKAFCGRHKKTTTFAIQTF